MEPEPKRAKGLSSQQYIVNRLQMVEAELADKNLQVQSFMIKNENRKRDLAKWQRDYNKLSDIVHNKDIEIKG